MIAKPSTLLSTSAAATPTPATPMPAQVPMEPRKRQLEVHESGNAVRSPTTPMGLGGVLGRQRSPSPRPPPSAEEPREGSAPVRAQLPQEKRAQAALRSTPERGLPYRPRPFSSSRSPHRDQPPMDDRNHLDMMRAALQQPSTSSRRQLLPQPHRSTSQKSVESRGSSCCSHMSSYSRDGESPVLGGYQDKYRNEFTKPIKSRRSSEGSWGPRQPPNRSRSKSHS